MNKLHVYPNNNLSKCVKINPEGVKSATISNGYPEGRYFDIGVEQLNGESTALLSVTKDTVDVATYENNIWTNRYSLATKNDLLRLSRTYIGGDSYADAKNLSIPPGIYSVNPEFKNIPETTCIFRKNCASVPEERSAIPLQTEQSSAG